VSTWGGSLEVHRKPPVPKSRFVQELEAQALEAQEEEENEQEDGTCVDSFSAAGCVCSFAIDGT
jgi:hypothetical protein